MSLFIVCSFSAKAQDTTIVTNFTMQVKDWLIVVPILNNSADSTMFFPFTKLRNACRSMQTTPVLTANFTIDTISVTTIAAMYLAIGNTASGYSVLTPFQTSLSPYRSANSNLNRQCTQVENNYVSYMGNMFNALFKILRGY